MSIFALYSIKGGVGKTASAVNLAHLSALNGYSTLLWDLDPQGASSYYFRIKPKIKGGRERVLSKKKPLDDLIKGSDFANLDLLPADFSYRHLDVSLNEKHHPSKLLKKIMQPLTEEYEHIFLDCPPSISILSENIFRAADSLLVPVIPTTLSLRTLKQLYDFCENKGLDKVKIRPFFSMVDQRRQLHKQILLGLRAQYPDIFAAFVPYAADIERMGIQRAPVSDYAQTDSPSVQAYQRLWDELMSQ